MDTVTVETSPDGRVINLEGTIGLGSADKLQNILDASPDATTLILSSDGGREGEALELAERVKNGSSTVLSQHRRRICGTQPRMSSNRPER